jgi:hypothetical protein
VSRLLRFYQFRSGYFRLGLGTSVYRVMSGQVRPGYLRLLNICQVLLV